MATKTAIWVHATLNRARFAGRRKLKDGKWDKQRDKQERDDGSGEARRRPVEPSLLNGYTAWLYLFFLLQLVSLFGWHTVPAVCSLDEVEYMPPTPAVDVGAAGGVEPAGLRSGEVDDAPAGGGVLVGIAVEVGEMKVKWVMPGLELAELESDDPFAHALAPPSPLPPPPSAPTRRPLVTHAPTTSRPTTASTSNSAATMACTASKPNMLRALSLTNTLTPAVRLAVSLRTSIPLQGMVETAQHRSVSSRGPETAREQDVGAHQCDGAVQDMFQKLLQQFPSIDISRNNLFHKRRGVGGRVEPSGGSDAKCCQSGGMSTSGMGKPSASCAATIVESARRGGRVPFALPARRYLSVVISRAGDDDEHGGRVAMFAPRSGGGAGDKPLMRGHANTRAPCQLVDKEVPETVAQTQLPRPATRNVEHLRETRSRTAAQWGLCSLSRQIGAGQGNIEPSAKSTRWGSGRASPARDVDTQHGRGDIEPSRDVERVGPGESGAIDERRWRRAGRASRARDVDAHPAVRLARERQPEGVHGAHAQRPGTCRASLLRVART
ncbi:hypothetical protein B0H14DRAFT_3595210 [Mycena olivaceomarginata]|nr:hypothetical protein B0H14DRAFT_3595210 [Mycena olivaceomarginata]